MIKDQFERMNGKKKETYYMNWDGVHYYVAKATKDGENVTGELVYKNTEEKDVKSYFDNLKKT